MTSLSLPTQPYLFISYASQNHERVLQVTQALDRIGVRYWLDRDAIEGGASYGTVIADAIRNSAAFLLMCSEGALASRNVKQEIQLAWKYARPYIPLLLERCAYPPDVEYWLEGSQWIEVLDHPEPTWLPRMIRALEPVGVDTTTGDEVIYSAQAAPAEPVLAPSGRRTLKTTLPVQLTSFVGREAELADLKRLLEEHRLVTLTGPGGTGKTRLARAAAQQVQSRFADGVAFVDLAPISDASLVTPTIAQAIGLQVTDGRPVAEALVDYLQAKRVLLILDNFEQVVDAAPFVHDLLVAAPKLTALVTSRIVLRTSGVKSDGEVGRRPA